MDLKLNAKQQSAVDAALRGENLALFGSGGTGKSTIVPHIVEQLQRNGQEVILTASTGIAASHIGGSTLHSVTGINCFCEDCTATKSCTLKKHKHLLLERIHSSISKSYIVKKFWFKHGALARRLTLVIEEISMISGALFEALDHVSRELRDCKEPWGGIQLIVVGDFLQLPPVNAEHYVFETESWRDCKFTVVELTEIYRQSDREFIEVLQKVRYARCDEQVHSLLASRLHAKLDTSDGILPTRLRPTNAEVDGINQRELALLPGEAHSFTASIEARGPGRQDFLQSYAKKCMESLTCPQDLRLKPGAQVLVTTNLDIKAGLFNGTRAVVVDVYSDTQVAIKTANGIEHVLEPFTFVFKNGQRSCIIKQIPLRLAWAITVHKSQGMSIDRLEVACGRSNFAASQIYVALSRARTLEGLTLTELDLTAVFVEPRVLRFYDSQRPVLRQQQLGEVLGKRTLTKGKNSNAKHLKVQH